MEIEQVLVSTASGVDRQTSGSDTERRNGREKMTSNQVPFENMHTVN